MATEKMTREELERLVVRIWDQNENDKGKLNLRLLNLDQVPLQLIQDHYKGSTLLDLSLSQNAISYITPQFTLKMTLLTKLDLSHNYVRALPENFGLLRNLRYLNLKHNLLETLPVSMGRMTRLRFLCISDNPFRSPLKEFLGPCKSSEIPDVIFATLVTQFLGRLSHPTMSSNTPEVTKKSCLVHYVDQAKKNFPGISFCLCFVAIFIAKDYLLIHLHPLLKSVLSEWIL